MELELDKLSQHEVTTDLAELSPLLQFAVDTCKEEFMENGGIEAKIAVECDTDENMLIGIPNPDMFFKSNRMKSLLSIILRQFVSILVKQDKKPTVIFSCTEAWMSNLDKNDEEGIAKVKKEGVSAQDDKLEVLMFNFESKTQIRMITYEIIRSTVDDSFVVSPEPKEDCTQDKKPGARHSKFQVWLDGEIIEDKGVTVEG